MKTIFLPLLLLLLLTACQGDRPATLESTSSSVEEITRPAFINFDYLESQSGTHTPGRRMEAFQANVSLQAVGERELVILTEALDANAADQQIAYVFETATSFNLEATELPRAWVVFLQDHLLVFSEDNSERYRFSIANRPFDSPVINESADFNYSYAGPGLARYANPQPVRQEDLMGVNSYLEARSQTEN